MKKKPIIEFEKEQREDIMHRMRKFLEDECEVELGHLAARRLLDYVTETLGPHYYNKAIEDASAFMNDKAEDMYALLK